MIRIKDNLDGQTPNWSKSKVKKIDGMYEVKWYKGQVLEANF